LTGFSDAGSVAMSNIWQMSNAKMPSDTNGVVGRNAIIRSQVTNGSKLHLFGDGRSAGARRFRDLLSEFAAEVGGLNALPATAQQLVRRLAQVSVELEVLEATRASGQAIDPVTFVTIVNSQRRLLRDLEALKTKSLPSRQPTLQEHLRKQCVVTAAPAASSSPAKVAV
jgi:hypothetical protein